MVQVHVLGVALDAKQQHIVLLKPLVEELGESRVLPIWIGEQEATSILVAVSGASAPRPLSHDLMKTLLDALDADVDRVEVERIDGGTFYASITLRGPSGAHVIDARPSDAIALAVRMHAPLFVAEEVLAEAAIPGSFIDQSGADEETEHELDEFKKFIEGVDPEDFKG
ncbi:bifunctional nuclease family protein [Brevibacterium sp.]|uniref:bifunctional nuclease family protein n=1 Tax=Brevibacterium sp. TaxID=1701 RepID=UPI0028119E16|nr:bifunctional nuclease family protein [Brevibacterium sp.]